MDIIFFVFQVLILFFLAAFFSCSETAITSVTNTEKRSLHAKKNKTTLRLLSIKDQIVSATLVGTNIVNNSIAGIVTAFTIGHFTSKHATTISTILVSILLIFFAEILPKSLAAYRSLPIVKAVSPILQIVRYVFSPITFVLGVISNFVLKILSQYRKKGISDITDEKLQTLIDISFEDGALNQDEKKLLTGAIRLRDLKLRNIVTPVFELAVINDSANIQEAIDVFCTTKFSRLLVCKNNNKNEVIGMVHYKDILFNEDMNRPITEIMRSVEFLPESVSVLKIITVMKTKQIAMVIAIDEYGQSAGIATIDDIITAVFGSIQDEYDDNEDNDILQVSAHLFKLAGDTKLFDLNKTLALNGVHVELNSNFYDTVAGFILEHTDDIPKERERIVIQDIEFEIEKVIDRKIECIVMNTSFSAK